MKILRLSILICTFSLILSNSNASEGVFVSSPSDLKILIDKNNFNIKLLRQQVRSSQAVIDGVRGAYYPILSSDINYSDDQKEPTSTFQPARVKNNHFGLSLHQRTPVGVSGTIGFANDRTELFQSEPANAMLPYPATYKQPVMFAKLEVDILENFMGYISTKELDQFELDKEASILQQKLVRDRLYLTSSSLFWNIQAMSEMKILIVEILSRFNQLEKDISRKAKRKMSNPGDVYKLKANIAKRELDIIAIDKNIENFKKAIIEMVSVQERVSITSSKTLSEIQDKVEQCEAKILSQGKMEYSWSSQFEVLNKNVDKAALEKQIMNRKILPDIKLFASYAHTGTDTDKDRSHTEMFHGDRPQKMVGVNFSMELSPSLRKSAKTFGDTAFVSSHLAFSQFSHESQSNYLYTQEKIRNMRDENELIEDALEYEFEQMKDMNRRYKQGRVSLFELVQEEGAVLQTKLQHKELWIQRIDNVHQFLSHFDNFECENINY